MRHDAIIAVFALTFCAAASSQAVATPAPPSFNVETRTPVPTVHAEGVQLYECKQSPAGRLEWVFREPIATLIDAQGKTVGRHFAGPTWAFDDGQAVKAKPIASAPGQGERDISLLKLQVTERHGEGAMSGASQVLRLNTHGGVFGGACDSVGALHGEPYSADYAFVP